VIGERIDRLARRFVREDNYRMIVAPAIADLQYEAPRGRINRARAYIDVWRAAGAALLDDTVSDITRTFTRRSATSAATVAGGSLIAILALHVLILPWNWGFALQDEFELFALLVPSLVVSAWPAVMLPGAAVIARKHRAGTARAVLVGACGSGLVLIIAIDGGVTRTNQRFREIAVARQGHRGPLQPGPRERTTWDLAQRDDRASQVEVHARLALCASTIGWALVGLALARASTAALVALGVLAYGLMASVLSASPLGVTGPAWIPWIPTVTLFIAGAIASRGEPGHSTST
jgi:hypothetical protein